MSPIKNYIKNTYMNTQYIHCNKSIGIYLVFTIAQILQSNIECYMKLYACNSIKKSFIFWFGQKTF